MLKIVQECRDLWLDSRVTCDWQAAKVGTRVEHVGELKSHASCCTTGQKSKLARPLACNLNSRLSPVARSSHQTILFGKNWLFTFLFTLPYIYPYTHNILRASRENFERETLEKNKIDSSTIFTYRLFKFLYSLPLHCQILERYIIKTFSHHTHICEKAIWCLGSS